MRWATANPSPPLDPSLLTVNLRSPGVFCQSPPDGTASHEPYMRVCLFDATVEEEGQDLVAITGVNLEYTEGAYYIPCRCLLSRDPSIFSVDPPALDIRWWHSPAKEDMTAWVVAPTTANLTKAFLDQFFSSLGHDLSMADVRSNAVSKLKFVSPYSVAIIMASEPVSYVTWEGNGGQHLRMRVQRTFGYVDKALRLKADEIKEMRDENTRTLSKRKRLHLVLDLDHTLLHSIPLDKLSDEEQYLKTQAEVDPSLHVTRVGSKQHMTKLRPFVSAFLSGASKLYDLSIYTLGKREYADQMVKLLHPKGEQIFDGRVISKEDCTIRGQKNLDVLLVKDPMIIILDDTKTVWRENEENLIVMPRYRFFSFGGKDGETSFSVSRTDESNCREEAKLLKKLELLTTIHNRFYNGDLERDVKKVLKGLKEEVLRGVIIVFSGLSDDREFQELRSIAEELGAEWLKDYNGNATHVVARRAGTPKWKKAIEDGKYLLRPDWIHDTYLKWERQPEDKYGCISS